VILAVLVLKLEWKERVFLKNLAVRVLEIHQDWCTAVYRLASILVTPAALHSRQVFMVDRLSVVLKPHITIHPLLMMTAVQLAVFGLPGPNGVLVPEAVEIVDRLQERVLVHLLPIVRVLAKTQIRRIAKSRVSGVTGQLLVLATERAVVAEEWS